MIVQQHDKASVSKRFGEFRDTVLSGSRIAVGHRDCRPEMFAALRQIEPRAELDAAINSESDVFSDCHSCLTLWRVVGK
jgi:hypothetical protein